jgi:hypothetical protein
MTRESRWRDAIALHALAAAEMADAAAAVRPERWTMPRGAGKWSPAEEVQHLILAYDVLLRELRDGSGMTVLTPPVRRWFLRLALLPWLLAGKPFPRGVRAPREVRPGLPEGTQEDVIARFRDRAAEFVAEISAAREQRPRTRLTHAYLGKLDLHQALRFCAQHIRHHQRHFRGDPIARADPAAPPV